MGAQSSKPAVQESFADEKARMDSPPAYSTDVDVREDHGEDRAMGEGLMVDDLKVWNKSFEANPVLALSRLVLTDADPIQALLSRRALLADPQVFNLTLKGVDGKGTYPGPRTNQASSGRCWIFATLHVVRYTAAEKLNLTEFEISQNYLFFYDKLEKANYYLESMIELREEPLDSRTLSYLNTAPVYDGGDFEMARNLILKYGMVPHSICPDTHSATSSAHLDSLLCAKLREYSLLIRSASSASAARLLKSKFLAEVYNVCAVTLGVPPRADATFTWEYNDKDGKFCSWTGTPKEFYEQYGKRKGMDMRDSVALVHDARNETGVVWEMDKYGSGNVWGEKSIRYVNTPIEALEQATIACIRANTPLYFQCDVGRSSHTTTGIMDSNLYPIETAYGFSMNMSKADRFRTGESAVTHAMVITAVHLDKDGKPVRYRVENSWSADRGDKGWFLMTAEWFRDNVYQVVLPRQTVGKEWLKVWDEEEVRVLEVWDAMGSLARKGPVV